MWLLPLSTYLLEDITLENAPQDLTLEEELMMARIFFPLLHLEPEELSDRLDLLQTQEPLIPEIALHAIVQIRIGMAELLEKIPPAKRTQENRLKFLRAAFFLVMQNKVSPVLESLYQNSSALTDVFTAENTSSSSR